MNTIITIIVTYNRKKLLEESINALLNQNYKNFDILIVDNASTDNTYDDVVKKYENERLRYINTGKNLGGAGGFNFGLRQAIQEKYKYAWVMDDDSIPNEDALNSIIKKTEKLNNEFSFVNSFVKWTDGTYCKMNTVHFNEKEFFNDYNKVNDKLLPVESATFVGCYINLEIAQKVGLPIKEFFIYADDREYTLRLSNAERAYIDMDSIIIHKMKENTGSNIQDVMEERINRYYYDYRNKVYILMKTKGVKGFCWVCIKYFSTLFKILKKARTKKLKRIWIMTKGTFAGLFFHPKIEYVE